MKRFNQKTLNLMTVPKTTAERAKNISILKENHQFHFLESTGDEKILFRKNDSIPRYLEKYLVVDFERKRSMISEILFEIHLRYPEIFSLAAYSNITQRIFSVITKYCWSGENAGIVIRLISIHLRAYLSEIPESFIISVFQQHDVLVYFDSSELRTIIHSCTNEYNIPLQRRSHVQASTHNSIEDIHYLQKVFRKNFEYFSGLFGKELLEGFLQEDIHHIARHREKIHNYIKTFQKILLSKISSLNMPSEKKVAYKIHIIRKPSLRNILSWSDLILRHS